MNMASLCILYDSKTAVHSSFASAFGSLAQCLAARHVDKSSRYFANAANARVKIADVAVLCQFVDHKGYSCSQVELESLEHLMYYLKSVLCYNLDLMVHDGEPGKNSVESVIKRCHESFDVGGSGMRNQHLLEMMQLVNLYAAYQFLSSQASKTSESQERMLKDKKESFCLLYVEHKKLLDEISDQRVHRMYHRLTNTSDPEASNLLDSSNVAGILNLSRPIDPIDVEDLSDSILSKKDQIQNMVPTEDEINANTATSVDKSVLNDFYKRYKEVLEWRNHIKRKTPSSMKKLREDYKKIPITKSRIEDTIKSISDSQEKSRLSELKSSLEESTKLVSEKIQEVWSNWKGALSRQIVSNSKAAQIYTEMAKLEDSQITLICNLLSLEGCFRKEQSISIVFDKLEIGSHILDILKLLRDERPLRSKKSTEKQCDNHLDRINLLISRFNHSADQREMKLMSIWQYLESKYDVKLDRDAKPSSSRNDGKRKHRSKSPIQAKNSRSRSTNLRKRSPAKESSKERSDLNFESSSSIDRVAADKNKAKDLEKGSSSTSKARNRSKSRPRGETKSPKNKSPNASQKSGVNPCASKSARVISINRAQVLATYGSLKQVQVKLNNLPKDKSSLSDVQKVLKNYKLDQFFNNEALLLAAKARLVHRLKPESQPIQTQGVPSAVHCLLSDQLTTKDLTILVRIRDQISSGSKEIKQAATEFGKSTNIDLEVKTLVWLCQKYVFACHRPLN